MGAVNFGGRTLKIPQAAVDAISGFGLAVVLGAVNNIVAIGECTKGAPASVGYYRVKGYEEAKRILGSGPLVDGLRNLYYPGGEKRGASVVYAMRVNPATQSSTTLVEAGDDDSIDLTSVDYGLLTTGIRYKVEESTNGGADASKLTIHDTNDDVYEVGDDLGIACSITYTGAGDPATLTIASNTLTTSCTGATEDNLDIDLTAPAYNTIQKLVNAINDHANYTCTLWAYLPTTSRTLASTTLDDQTAISILTAKYLTAYQAIVVDWVNNYSDYVTAEINTARDTILKVVGYTYLAGGIEGVTTTTHYEDALAQVNNEDVQLEWVDSTSAAVWAVVDENCITYRRVGFTGVAYGTALATVENNATVLNSDRIAHCYPGFTAYNDAGVATNYGSNMLAAKVCGVAAGLPEMEPLTRKLVGKIIELEYALTEAEQEDCIDNGVLAVVKKPGGTTYRVVQGLSTLQFAGQWTETAQTPEISLRRTLDYILRDQILTMDQYIGTHTGKLGASELFETLTSFLKTQVSLGRLVEDYGDDERDPVPAFTVSNMHRVADAWYNDESLNLPGPVNFILSNVQVSS
ncbi:MAG TPA: hypothetical protein VNA25_03360 [Phycisphaerae bacterium]|nr:hypothetical protein [Phycisphaerae bacterium]